jgi:8-amino-7-oxononanoate synthase
MSTLPRKLQQKLKDRIADNSLRRLGQTTGLVDFSSNDYLGFAKNETIFSKTFQSLLNYNIAENGATGSRLLSGNHQLYTILEQKLTAFHEADAALVFNSGYDANVGFFSAVPLRGDVIFYDEHIHASIRDGIGMSHAKSYKFSHNDLSALKAKIETTQKDTGSDAHTEVYVVTESVFSMDGDMPDLKSFAGHCNEQGYRLIVDEAHAVGVLGKRGEGYLQALKLQEKVFARIVTFGKAIGSHGAAILGSTDLNEYLVNFSRSLIYSTGLPPHGVATSIAAYTYLEEEGQAERQRLLDNIGYFKQQVKRLKLEKYFSRSGAAIQSCVITSNDKVKTVSEKLKDKGFDVKAILPPTVPEGQERLRFCVHSYNSKEEIGLVLELLSRYL